MTNIAKNTICLWYDGDAEEAARFYAETFPDSSVDAVHRSPGDYPDGKEGSALTVQFTVLGVACLGLNGRPAVRRSGGFPVQAAPENEEATAGRGRAIVRRGGQGRRRGRGHAQ